MRRRLVDADATASAFMFSSGIKRYQACKVARNKKKDQYDRVTFESNPNNNYYKKDGGV